MIELAKNAAGKNWRDGIEFLFEGPLGQALSRFLQEDVDSAQFSKVYRAFYQVRPILPIFVRQMLQRLKNSNSVHGTDGFTPHALIEVLRTLETNVPCVWPDSSPMAFVLTHDVETHVGVKLCLDLARIEEDFGFRSSWNFVPHKYHIDMGVIHELRARGHEIGVHGYNHDGRLFLNKRIFDSRVNAMNEALVTYDAVGFRTPMVHRNLDWMQSLHIEYDSSCFDADPFQAMPGGVQSFWPFQCGHFVELPYTMPQDHTLFVSLGETTDNVWREKLATIREFQGMALMLTHPDYLDTPSLLNIYRDFLAYVRDNFEYWHALPREVARDFRSRQLKSVVASPNDAALANHSRPETSRISIPSHGDLKALENHNASCKTGDSDGSPKSYLVTGAAGFIGSRVAAQLLEAGHQVVGVDNLNDYYSPRLKEHRLEGLVNCPKFRFEKLDIENRKAVEQLFDEQPFDAVLNLAARAGVRASLEHPEIYYSTNQGGTLNLLQAMKSHDVKKFVLASTSSLYAGQPMPFVETMSVNEPISPYAASKKAAEVMAYTWHYLHGIDVSVVRYFTVYGPCGRPDMSPFRFFDWISTGQPIRLYGDGSQQRDFTYVDCVAKGTIAAIKPVGYEIFNIGNEHPHSIRDMISKIESLVGKSAIIKSLPAHPTDMPATWADSRKAREILGWSAKTSFEEGLEKTWNWHKHGVDQFTLQAASIRQTAQ